MYCKWSSTLLFTVLETSSTLFINCSIWDLGADRRRPPYRREKFKYAIGYYRIHYKWCQNWHEKDLMFKDHHYWFTLCECVGPRIHIPVFW